MRDKDLTLEDGEASQKRTKIAIKMHPLMSTTIYYQCASSRTLIVKSQQAIFLGACSVTWVWELYLQRTARIHVTLVTMVKPDVPPSTSGFTTQEETIKFSQREFSMTPPHHRDSHSPA